MFFETRHLTTRLGAVLALVLATLFVVTPAAPAAADNPVGWYRLYNLADGKCLEGDLAHINDNGDQAQLWGCWNDPGNQQWYLSPLGNNTYKLINAASHTCLESDLAHSGNGTKVQLWGCWNDPGNQQWHIYLGNYPNEIKLVNAYAGLCLDSDLGHINDNGDRMQLWTCWNDPDNQHFTLAHIPTP